jgi:cell division protein FtsW
MYRNIKAHKKVNNEKGSVNKTLLYIFIALILFGTIMIFDASVYKASEVFNDPFYFLKQHIIWLIVGGSAGAIMYYIDYKLISKFAVLFLLFTLTTLILVLVFGNDINGSRRWIEIAGMTFQPAEFAKLSIIIYLSAILSKESKQKANTQEALKKEFIAKLIQFSVVVGTILLLVMLEPDMGTTIVIAATSFLIFFLSGEDRIHTFGSMLIAGGLGVLGLLAGTLESYRLDRIKTFLHLLFQGEVDNPTGEGYQIQQILIGIGSSGFWGKGFGQSRQRFGYLVENTAFTDSIFAVILEELGFAIALILVGLFLTILYFGFKLSMSLEDRFAKLLVAGITVWLVIQALLNMAANVALIPLTGIPLPFFTYGGSNTIVTLAAIGLLLNISRYAKTDAR